MISKFRALVSKFPRRFPKFNQEINDLPEQPQFYSPFFQEIVTAKPSFETIIAAAVASMAVMAGGMWNYFDY